MTVIYSSFFNWSNVSLFLEHFVFCYWGRKELSSHFSDSRRRTVTELVRQLSCCHVSAAGRRNQIKVEIKSLFHLCLSFRVMWVCSIILTEDNSQVLLNIHLESIYSFVFILICFKVTENKMGLQESVFVFFLKFYFGKTFCAKTRKVPHSRLDKRGSETHLCPPPHSRWPLFWKVPGKVMTDL